MIAPKIGNLNFVYGLYQSMIQGNLGYVYRGEFTNTLTDRILSLAEANLDDIGESSKIKKRVYFIMVESLQNITRHQDSAEETGIHKDGVFIIQRKDNDYYITTGNLTDNSNVELLRAKLQIVNSLDKDSLKAYYKKLLSEGSLSEKGGAGLGLVEMARKSGNKLAFDFKTINDKYAYFYLQTKIPSSEDAISEEGDYSGNLETAIDFHNKILDKELKLVYQGNFSQENVKSVLSMAEGSISKKNEIQIQKKVFNIIVEMLQNIFKHADDPDSDTDGKPGIFMIGKDQNDHLLTTGNLIRNSACDAIREKLERINDLNQDELDEMYARKIMEDSPSDEKGAGLGLIDMRIKSNNKLLFSFVPINDEYSFFSMMVTVSGTNN